MGKKIFNKLLNSILTYKILKGANQFGQLGLGNNNECELTPKIVANLPSELQVKNIISVKGGGGHVLILDNNGKVFACGWNQNGQLGNKSDENTSQLITIESNYFNNEKIVKISSGWNSSAALTENGDLYVWGSNVQNQLGFQHVKWVRFPTKLNLPEQQKVKEIAMGMYHLTILTESNLIYFVGKSKLIEAIRIMDNSDVAIRDGMEFVELHPEIRATHITTGQYHVVFCDNLGNINAVGDTKFGQCGEGSIHVDAHTPFKQLESGWTHSGFLNSKSNIYLWGRSSYGQMGCGSIDGNYPMSLANLKKVKIPEDVEHFELGYEHGIAVSKKGNVFTWGWNEHGNCGDGKTDCL